MSKPVNYSYPDGNYNDAAYHRAYNAQHKDKRALWRLRSALNECRKYPTIMGEARTRCADFAAEDLEVVEA